MLAILTAWTQLFGLLTFELFGQTRNLVGDDEALFRAAATSMAASIGLAGDLTVVGGRLLAAEAEQVLADLAHLDLLGTLGDPVAPVVPVDVLERHVA